MSNKAEIITTADVATVPAGVISEERAARVLEHLSALLASLTPADAQALLTKTDAEASALSEQVDEHQRALKAHRAEVKAKVRPLVARLDQLAAMRLQLATRAPSLKIG